MFRLWSSTHLPTSVAPFPILPQPYYSIAYYPITLLHLSIREDKSWQLCLEISPVLRMLLGPEEGYRDPEIFLFSTVRTASTSHCPISHPSCAKASFTLAIFQVRWLGLDFWLCLPSWVTWSTFLKVLTSQSLGFCDTKIITAPSSVDFGEESVQ